MEILRAERRFGASCPLRYGGQILERIFRSVACHVVDEKFPVRKVSVKKAAERKNSIRSKRLTRHGSWTVKYGYFLALRYLE